MQTGQIIMKLRSDAGFTQARLADMLFVSRDLISKWETGKRLPEYMIPGQIVYMESLPRNLNGKIDRAGLAGK